MSTPTGHEKWQEPEHKESCALVQDIFAMDSYGDPILPECTCGAQEREAARYQPTATITRPEEV